LDGPTKMDPTHKPLPVRSGIVVAEATAITPHNAALYEAGKKLLIDSVSVSQEFCKFMIGSSSGAIPIYVGLLVLILPKTFAFHSLDGVLLVIPAFLFLVSSVVFTIGFLPDSSMVSLDLPNEIDAERLRTIRRRRRFYMIGLIIYCVAVASGILLCMQYLTHPSQVAPATEL
jgi:hypothetical protein